MNKFKAFGKDRKNSFPVRKGMMIRFSEDMDNPSARNWVVLPITKNDLRRSVNADSEGLYAFGGMWYGRNPMKIKSYGKIQPINEDVHLVKMNLHGMSVDEIFTLVD
jgi:hypothetical protein